MHFPAHPLWFWLVLAAPFLAWLVLSVAANAFNVSLKPLTRWLWAGYCLFAIPYFFLDPTDGHKALRFVAGVGLWGCFLMAMWIKTPYVFAASSHAIANVVLALEYSRFSYSLELMMRYGYRFSVSPCNSNLTFSAPSPAHVSAGF